MVEFLWLGARKLLVIEKLSWRQAPSLETFAVLQIECGKDVRGTLGFR